MSESDQVTPPKPFDVQKAQASLPTARFQHGENWCAFSFQHQLGKNVKTVVHITWDEKIRCSYP